MYFERHTYENQALPIFFSRQLRTASEPRYDLHWHETAEWIYVKSGRIEIRINDVITEYKPNDIIFISPQQPHSFRCPEGETVYYCLIPDNSITRGAGLDTRTLFVKNPIHDEVIREVYDGIIRECAETETGYASMTIANIVRMTVLAVRRHSDPGVKKSLLDDNAMRITKDVICYMEDHYAEDFSGETLAAHLGFSRSYLCHIVSKVTGQSLTENLLYIRCRKAKELLKKGVSVGDASYSAGFKNTSYFCRVYKRMMGVSPSSHRNK